MEQRPPDNKPKHNLDLSKPFGKYRLLAPLATGGMAEIYLASHSSLGGFEKLIVIKCILPQLAKDPQFVQMMLDEARIAAILNHPNVVQVFDVGCVNDLYYIAMEYLSGESLGTILGACGRRNIELPPELVAGILMQSAEGLHHAHTLVSNDGKALNIVHRDVSPQNIIVLYNGSVKVVDFGIAKAALSHTKTRTGVVKGKIAYMSPEQVLGEELDGRSDLFSLGIVMWECLTSRRLFKENSEFSCMQAIVHGTTPSPIDIKPGIPPELANISRKALERDRARRYQNATEFRNALAGYLKNSSKPADTMAIGAWMQQMFVKRIDEKRRLIEGAMAQPSDEVVDDLFGDLNQYSSETQALKTGAKTGQSEKLIEPPPQKGAKKYFAYGGAALAGALLLVGTGVGLSFLISPDKPPIVEPTPEPIPAADKDSGRSAVDVRTPSPEPSTPPTPGGAPTRTPTKSGGTIVKPPTPPIQTPTPMPQPTQTPTPTPTPTPVVTQRATGTVNVVCLPWCTISIDGKQVAEQSPLRDYVLPVGKHTVEVTSRQGKKDSSEVEIKKDEASNVGFRLY